MPLLRLLRETGARGRWDEGGETGKERGGVGSSVVVTVKGHGMSVELDLQWQQQWQQQQRTRTRTRDVSGDEGGKR